ncbi:MAG: prolyl oligopeptidase family serine peptidase [Bacteroidia bacterium]|nr:prolyl oligopeptidase family serine peptidase [Bacteroidia bacterium]MDW8346738.1 prolyl oligopeptidase family serine peptidase [Bacteroidia bacterium]
MLRITFFILTILLIKSSIAQWYLPKTPMKAVRDKKYPYPFWINLPKDYEAKKDSVFPFILYLHGRSAQGTDLHRVRGYGVPYTVDKGNVDLSNFIVVAPQTNKGWSPMLIKQMIDTLQKHYRIDSTRRYLTGMSMGGFGCWMTAGQYPDLFAAIAPVCGGGDVKDVERLKNVPTWVFHGDKDPLVGIQSSIAMIEELRKINGNVRFTIYKNEGHAAMVRVYDDASLYQWFLRHKKENSSTLSTNLREYLPTF